MIDDKKIEAAKEEIYEDRFLLNGEEVVFDNDAKEEMFYKEDIKEAIGLGAKWAINEFLKDLWHPNTEKPKAGKKILAYTIDGYETITYIGEGEIDSGTNWIDIVSDMAIASWCCLEDLLPKKGGENERT